MPVYQLLTDRTLAQASAITPTTLIHIVYTGDPSQNIAGSSYKAELQQLSSIFSGGTDTLVTGGTYSAGTITFTNSSGGTFPVTGLTDGSYYLPLSGGTVTGNTIFTQGLTATTLSASTYLNLPVTADTNFANTNLTLNNDRIHNLNGNDLFFSEDGAGFGYISFGIFGGLGTGSFVVNGSTDTTLIITDSYLKLRQLDNEFWVNPTETVVNETGYPNNFRVETDNNQNMFFVDGTNNKVGISTNTPSETLDVSGKTKTINFQMTSGATTGYVLTSDASGNASWQVSTGGVTFTGGTVSGATNFTNGLTANTMSASTLFVNGVQITGDTFVTGGTYSAGTITFTNNQNGQFPVTGLSENNVGIFGISNNLGEFTYYSKLQDAINNATSGDTIQMFANVTETSATTVTLKNEVNINMNGYKYELSQTSSDHCLSDNNVSINCKIYNGIISRSGSTYVNDTTSLALYIQNTNSNIQTSGVYFITTNTTAINNAGTIIGAYVDAYARGIVNSGKLFSVNVISRIETAIYCNATTCEVYDSTGRSYGSGYGIGMLIPSFDGIIVNSIGYSLGQSGIYMTNTKEAQSCIGYSTSNNGISASASILNDCKGYSSSNSAVFLQNIILATNIVGYSFTSYGVFISTPTNGVNSKIQNLTASSVSSYGCGLNATGTATLTVKNLQSTSLLSGGLGYPCIVGGNNNIKIMGGSLESFNSAECIYSAAPITLSYVDLSFKTSATPTVNVNITQGATGPMDAYGNVII